MIHSEYFLGKSAVFDWKQYKDSCFDSFILDEENQISLLEEAFCRIREIDNEYKVYVSTYPIEINGAGIRAYSDMIWIKTKLSCEDLEKVFSNYREIEPSAIFDLTDEEKGNVELYISDGMQYHDFEQVSNLFKKHEVKILYWD